MRNQSCDLDDKGDKVKRMHKLTDFSYTSLYCALQTLCFLQTEDL